MEKLSRQQQPASDYDKEEDEDDEDDEGSVDPADALFDHRNRQAAWHRQLQLEDDRERGVGSEDSNAKVTTSAVNSIPTPASSVETILANGRRVLCYNAFLTDQRFYDDCKHIDCHYIYFGNYEVDTDRDMFVPNNDTDVNLNGLDQSFPTSTPPLGDACTSTSLRGNVFSSNPWMIVEQDKSLGKGGLCWDAAFILGEFLVAKISNNYSSTTTAATTTTRVIELGSGTGLCGLILAKGREAASAMNTASAAGPATQHAMCITLTDLPALQPLLQRNVQRNFGGNNNRSVGNNTDFKDGNDNDETLLLDYCFRRNAQLVSHTLRNSQQTETAHDNLDGTSKPIQMSTSILDWGDQDDIERHGTFDIVLGADVVASLYDPLALANTIASLCHSSQSVVYISYKERLSVIHRDFEAAMQQRFDTMELLPQPYASRNRNPDVYILVARGKR